MRVSLIATTVLAAAAQAAYIVHMPRADKNPALTTPETRGVDELAAHAASHAQARRSGAHNLPRRRLVRRKKTGKCRIKTTDLGSSAAESTAQSSSTAEASSSSSSAAESSSSSSSSSHHRHSSATESSPTDPSAAASTSASSTDGSSSTDSSYGSASASSTDYYASSSSSTDSSYSSSSSAPSPSASSTGGDMTEDLMPFGAGIASWTTCPNSGKDHLTFSAAMSPLLKGKFPEEATAPDGSNCHVNKYPAGVVGGSGGFAFYTQGAANGVDVASAHEIFMSYAVWFAEGFDWRNGGKLPGVFGGVSPDAAVSCSGGRQDDSCFSVRPMWREGGLGELYDYVGPSSRAINDWCKRPNYVCNSNYGDSVERGAFHFTAGSWNSVGIRVRKNTPGQADGSHELFINGKSVINVSNISFSTQDVKLYGVMGQTFFGGSSVEKYAPYTEQTAYFKDWTLIVVS